MYRPYEFIDPARIAERAERDTCKGCPHERKERFFGADHKTCALGKPHGSRCDNYGKRGIMKAFDLFAVTPQDEIDNVLVDWYEWSENYNAKLGYGRVSASCKDFSSTSRQWMSFDEIGDEIDSRLKADVGRAVDPIVMALGLQARVAVQTAVRNMIAGHVIWVNPRYPESQDQDYVAAKREMRPKLEGKGLVGKA